MRSSLLVMLCLGCLAASGCRSDPRIQALERQLRMHEDVLYELEDLVEEYESDIASCKRENTSLRKELDEAGGPAGPTLAPPSDTRKRRRPAAKPKQDKPDDLAPPKIELPPGLDPLSRKRLLEELPAEPDQPGRPALIPADGDERIGESVSVEITQTDSMLVDTIRLNRLLTGGYNADGRDGDEGITAVIEPRDKDDNLMRVAAPISVVVLDPAVDGEASRVARWDFSAEQVAKVYRRTPLGEGFCLEMPWPNMPPSHDKLRVFVRYTRSDGHKLQVDRPITVALAGRVARDRMPTEPPTEATSQSAPPSTSWRQATSTADRRSPADPIRTASRPAARPSEPHQQGSAGRYERPVWSPNRYR